MLHFGRLPVTSTVSLDAKYPRLSQFRASELLGTDPADIARVTLQRFPAPASLLAALSNDMLSSQVVSLFQLRISPYVKKLFCMLTMKDVSRYILLAMSYRVKFWVSK